MAKNKVEEVMQCKNCCKGGYRSSGSSAVYGLGLIGALAYYMLHVGTLTEGLLGIGKSIVWPALLVFHLFQLFKM